MFKRATVFVLAAMTCTAYAGTAADVVSEISQEKYTDQLRNRLYTHLGNNRSAALTVSGADHDSARDYITEQFRSYGLEAYQDGFEFTRSKPPVGTFSGTNVVAKLTGTRYPDKMYILGAHYDSRGNPGADDDASGVAGLLEAARVLSTHRFEYTIVFIAFDFEEIGCSGANSYSQRHRDDGILGMVEMDMIAYNEAGLNRAEIWTGPPEPNPVSKALEAAMARYAADLTIHSGGGEWGSDHGPFAEFNSALLSENGPYSPYYHRSIDTAIDINGNDVTMPDGKPYIDYAYATKMLRGAVGWLVESAVLAE